MIEATHPLSREHVRTAFGRLMPRLSDSMRRLAEPLLDLIAEDGSASVQQLHARLFPATDSTKSASAQLNNVLKAISAAAQNSGLALSHQFEGSKQSGIAGRKLRFLGPPPLLVAETETLSAIEPAQRITDQQIDPLVQEHKVVLLTFNEHEFNAVRRAFWTDTRTPPQALSYPLKDRSSVSVDVLGSFGNIRLFHHHSRQGNRESQRAAADIHAALQPRAIVAVGIAFGADEGKQAVAEVLVSKFVVDYELGKVHKDGNMTLRGPRPTASRTWVRALELLDTRQNASVARTTWPKLHFGGLLSGEKLVDHIDYRNRLLALAHQDDIVGGEMEAAGLFTALDGSRTDWLVVKAICDWADGNKGQDKERRQQHAAANAAQVVHALINSGALYPDAIENETGTSGADTTSASRPKLPVDAKELMRRARLSEVDGCAVPYEPNRGSPVSLDTLDEQAHKLQAASAKDDTGLVAFEDILQWVSDPDSPPLYALLGEYGMGKTTTSQRVFEHLRAQHLRGELARPALYFDLRKVERLVPASDVSAGSVPSLQEAVEDCLKNGYLSDGLQPPSYADVISSIDQGAVVIFDGLDEVLSRIQDKQGLTFTGNLLRVLADAKTRRPANASTPTPKLLLSCRTQFFRSLREQNNHLTGEHRGAQPARQYRAVVLRPFTEQQIRAYLHAALPEADMDQLMKRIASVHNLTDLSKRPFTLKLVSRFLPQIERWQAEGRRVTGATLYREVAREWLIRDKEKQSFQPEDKERLAAALAAHLRQQKSRGLDAPALEAWLGAWLAQQPAGSDCLTKPRNLLQQDLRNATFLRRIDDETASRFEFSHSSLQEFFLAEHLATQALSGLEAPKDAALQDRLHATWAGPAVSDETLDFIGQILGEHPNPSGVTEVLNAWRKTYRPQASELLLRYALTAPATAPRPLLAGFDLRGAQLRGWVFGAALPTATAPLPMQGCLLQGADLREARFRHVRLDDADFSGARLEQASFEHGRLQRTRWADARLIGTVFRHCALQGCDLENALAYRAQLVACEGLPQVPGHSAPNSWLAPPAHPPTPMRATSVRQGLQWQPGHTSGVTAVAFSPDGQRIASASWDNTLRLWDAASGEALLTLQGHQDSVRAVAFSPDGQRIASASDDKTLRLWDAANGEVLLTLQGHQDSVRAVAFSPDGQRIASASVDKTLRLWDAASGETLLTLQGHQDCVTAVAFSPDGQRIASASRDNTLRMWDTASGESLLTLQGHQESVTAVAFSTDSHRIASASNDSTLRLWDAASGEPLLTLQGHQDSVTAAAFSPDGQLIASASDDTTLRLWDATSGEALLTLQGHQGSVTAVAFSPDGQRIASASWDNTLRLWDAANGEVLLTLQGHQESVTAVAFSTDSHRIASASSDKTLRLWDAARGEPLLTLQGHQGAVAAVAFSPDGQRIASASWDNTLRMWDAASGELLLTRRGHQGLVTAVAFSPDGQRIASASFDNTLRLWDAASGEPLLSLQGHQGLVTAVAFSPDGQRIASASVDRTLRLWDTASGESLLTLQGHQESVTAVAFSTDSHRIASASNDNTLRLWDATSGEPLLTLQGHQGWVTAVAFSPDGHRLVSASDDKTLRLWEAASGEALLTLRGHQGSVVAVAFSPDGQRIASASEDNTLRLWDAASGAWLRVHWTSSQGADQGHAVWVPPGVEAGHTEGCVISASGDAWRLLGWQVWDHPSAPGLWTRLPLGAYPGEPVGV